MRVFLSKESAPDILVQLLPFHIKYSGPANLVRYFRARPDNDERGGHRVSFRGRHMHGESQSLPEGYAGIVCTAGSQRVQPVRPNAKRKAGRSQKLRASIRRRLGSSRADFTEDDLRNSESEEEEEPLSLASHRRHLQAVGMFSAFTVWHPDGPGDLGDDAFVRSLCEWTLLSQCVHAKV